MYNKNDIKLTPQWKQYWQCPQMSFSLEVPMIRLDCDELVSEQILFLKKYLGKKNDGSAQVLR